MVIYSRFRSISRVFLGEGIDIYDMETAWYLHGRIWGQEESAKEFR